MAASLVGGRAESRPFVSKVICCARALAAGRRSHRPAIALRTTLAQRQPAAALVLHRPPRQCNTEGRRCLTSVRAAVCRTPQSSRRDRLENIINCRIRSSVSVRPSVINSFRILYLTLFLQTLLTKNFFFFVTINYFVRCFILTYTYSVTRRIRHSSVYVQCEP